MHTYTFKTVSGGRAKINAGSGFFVPKSNPGIFENSDSVLLNFNNEDDLIIYPANDTVIIDGTTHAAGSWSVTAMSDAINVLFPKANSSSGGTGGASARFGIEDNTSTVDRALNLNQHTLDIVGGTADFSGITSEIYQAPNSAGLYSQLEDAIHGQVLNQNGTVQLDAVNETLAEQRFFYITPTGIKIKKIGAAQDSEEREVVTSAQGIFADTSGNIPLVPDQSFDSNAEAVTALGVGKLYKSTTLINGSPIILITV